MHIAHCTHPSHWTCILHTNCQLLCSWTFIWYRRVSNVKNLYRPLRPTRKSSFYSIESVTQHLYFILFSFVSLVTFWYSGIIDSRWISFGTEQKWMKKKMALLTFHFWSSWDVWAQANWYRFSFSRLYKGPTATTRHSTSLYSRFLN